MPDERRIKEAQDWSIVDIFTLNGVFNKMDSRTKSAWVRTRAKLIVALDLKPPTLREPTRITERADGLGIDFHYGDEPDAKS